MRISRCKIVINGTNVDVGLIRMSSTNPEIVTDIENFKSKILATKCHFVNYDMWASGYWSVFNLDDVDQLILGKNSKRYLYFSHDNESYIFPVTSLMPTIGSRISIIKNVGYVPSQLYYLINNHFLQ